MSDPSLDQFRPKRLRRVAHGATWPVRRAAWALVERIFWPAQGRLQNFKRPTQAILATGLVGAVTMAAAAGVLLGAPDGETAATASPVAAVAPAPGAGAATETVSASTEPIWADAPPLRGATPSFESGRTDQRQRVAPDGRAAPVDEAGSAPVAPLVVDPTETHNVALKTAERFAKAFVTYEIGMADAKVGKAFRETAAARLVKALAQRPPRLPAGVDVPKAKVLNVVAGQRLGRTLSVSVALVRLGATSELRLQLDKTRTGWLISDVRG